MTSRDFCYWLQGLFEVGEPKQLDAKQVQMIRAHLDLVFKHEIEPTLTKSGDAKADKKQLEELLKTHQRGYGDTLRTVIC